MGKKTGVVTTDYLHGATPSAFSAHAENRNDTATIVDSQIASGVNLLCGSTAQACTDKKSDIESNGYAYCDDFSKIDASKNGDKAYWQFSLFGTSASVNLCDVTTHALDYLDNEKGFVIMIEQANIDKYSHSNDTENMVKCVKNLNDTVETILDWVGDRKDTAIIITADHETGALNVSTPKQTYNYIDTLDGNKMYYAWGSGDHTNDKVGVFAYGINPDFSSFSYYKSNHLIKNINVFDIMNTLVYDGNAYAK
jgi:alkaline phosphatase